MKNYVYKLLHSKEIARLEEMFEIQSERIINLWKENITYMRFRSVESLEELKYEFLESEGCKTENEFWAKHQFDKNEKQVVKKAFEFRLLMTESFQEDFQEIIEEYILVLEAYLNAMRNVNLFSESMKELLPMHIYIRWTAVDKILTEWRYFIREIE